MTGHPTVTVLIPARNEEADIERCLRAVLAQDHPHDRMEIVLVNGGSSDETVDVATRVLDAGDVSWRVVHNPTATTPSNLNAGLAHANGEVLCRVDARSLVPPDYVRRCAARLADDPSVVVVGGAQVARPRDASAVALGIARALNNRYAMGGANYRSGGRSGPVDTVYLGSFRTSELQAAGGWDDYFLTNQDFELNRRMSVRGQVWFDDALEVGYVPRRSLVELWHQYHRFGRWKVRYWHRTGDRPLNRQLVRLVGPPVAAVAGMAVFAVGSARARVTIAGLALIGALGVEAYGTTEPDAGLAARLVGMTAIAAASTGWLTGVYRELGGTWSA